MFIAGLSFKKHFDIFSSIAHNLKTIRTNRIRYLALIGSPANVYQYKSTWTNLFPIIVHW